MENVNLGELAALLTDTRTLTRDDQDLRHAIASHRCHVLAPTQVVARDAWQALLPWEKSNLCALATGRSMTKGVLVGRSAARVLGIPVLPLSADAVEVALPSGGTPSRKGRMPSVRYRKAGFGAGDTTECLGVRVTTPVRTCLDIARYHGFAEGLIAVDWVLRNTECTVADLRVHLAGMGRCVGKPAALRVLQHTTPHSESPLESWFRAVLIEHGVTGWRFQAPIRGFRADFLFDDFLIVEIDGRSKYAQAAHDVLMRERDRERALINLGYVIRRVYFDDLRRDMDGVLRMIDQARATRRPGIR
ncbi:endonuclease domain-containing protein [Corynebacterium sp.]|uniref:endonuclease domain-containing protein n=1 Tax=Corynebacterium sp. TaxID=1720 RepID=UPI002A90A091|nr:DUF559 domain-containing protein [Corynebacterium sp.]MDY5785549.1 DUF559 domain-containing protein [Corynebacterium sp.]